MSKADTLRPGDIWTHRTMGRLAVTDEEPDRYPGMLKCYWMIGGNPKPPYSFRHPKNTTGLTLISRMQAENEQ
jgi:hypothetical protein